jgi:predicted acetyltransferase
MDIDIRPINAEEFDLFVKVDSNAFGDHPDAETTDLWRHVSELDRTLAAFDGEAIVGTTLIDTMSVTVPGADLPMAGVTAVGVLPTHRRRGILTALMQRQLADVRDRGEPLAGLWASEGSIYGRFGYGLATLSGRMEADRDRVTFVNQADDQSGSLRLVSKDEALGVVPDLYERVRRQRPGMPSRGADMWAAAYADLERWREGASALFCTLHETSGAVDGFCSYRVKSEWSDGLPGGTVSLRHLFAETPAAYEALWRYVFGVDLVKKVEAWGRPSDEPLLHMITEPRRLRFALIDALYIRVVDVPSALGGRTYGVEGSIVLGVRDAFCPWIEGTYELHGGADGAECRPSSAEPQILLDATALGAAFLGGTTFHQLAAAGRVAEERPGAIDLASRMFAADPLPWCPLEF